MLHLLIGLVGGVGIVWLIHRARDSRIVLHPIENCPAVDDPRFPHVIGPLLGSSILPGNRIDILLNGDAIFPPMLAAIRQARDTICFETYIYWSGTIGDEFAEALAGRARAGVRVLILLDYVGSKPMKAELLDLLRDAGCELERFHPPDLLHPSRINNRTHRKLLVVDGRIGFTGGVGIGDNWRGHAQDREHWRDTHFRVTGPAVSQMQAVFMVNWIKTVGRVETAETFFPEPIPTGDTPAQMFHSSPDDGSESVRLMYLLGIRAAQKSIRLTQAYFLPDEQCRQALTDAVRRGVRVEIITPGRHNDSNAVRRGGRATWGELLGVGVRIYEYQPTMLHAKGMIVDSLWCAVGSANFDNRSFRLNDEANLNFLNADLARTLEEHFETDLTRSREITLEEWRARPLGERFVEWFSRRIRRLL